MAADRAARRAAAQAWRAVPLAERRAVLNYAKQGQRHPDPTVAAAASDYAQLAATSGWSWTLILFSFVVGVALIVEAVVLDGPWLALAGVPLVLAALFFGDLRLDAAKIQRLSA